MPQLQSLPANIRFLRRTTPCQLPQNRRVLISSKLSPTQSLPLSRTYASETKPVSPHIGFYKNFGRPLSKVLLGAFFSYQLVYFVWAKLEKDEKQADKNAEIAALQGELREVSGLQQRKT